MSIRMLKFKVTSYGTFESGQVVAGLPAHLEYQLMESGDAVSAEVADFAAAVVAAAGGLIGPSAAFAALPDAADNAGNTYRVTDIGKPGAGALFISDGVNWVPLNGRVQCMRTTIPFIHSGSWSVGNNGALTLPPGVALDRIYPRSYMYFPSGALFSGSAAGWYWTVMSSTTAGVVYNNVYNGGYPEIPTTAGFTTTGPGAFTQTAGVDLTCLSFTLPGNAVSKFGGMQSRLCMTAGGAGGTKTGKVFFGASPFHVTTIPSANNFANGLGGFAVDGNPTVLKVTHAEQSTGHTNGVTYTQLIFTNDITIDKTIGVTLKISAAATDWVVLQECEIELIGG